MSVSWTLQDIVYIVYDTRPGDALSRRDTLELVEMPV